MTAPESTTDIYETYTLAGVKETAFGFVLETQDDGVLGVTENRDGVTPKPGDTARFYGRGFGYTVRGVEIVGKGFLYYRTEAEDRAKSEAYLQADRDRKQAELDVDISSRNKRWSKLPFPYQQRRIRFEANNRDWRRDYELYELMVCEEAARFAAHFETPALLLGWACLPYEQQQKRFKYSEDHSGNSFQVAVRLAEMALNENAVGIAAEHGALCPLVGCTRYGCASAPERPDVSTLDK